MTGADLIQRIARRFGLAPRHGTSIDDVLRGINRGDYERPSKEQAMSIAVMARCVRLIADTIATLPFEIEDVPARRAKRDLAILARRPNPFWSAVNLWEKAIEDALLDGLGCIGIERNGFGDLLGLRYLENARPIHDDRRRVFAYRDRYGGIWQHEDVIVFTNDEFNGVSSPGLLDRGAGKAVAILLAYQDYTTTELKRGFLHNLILRMAGRPTKDSLDALKADIKFTESQGLDGQAFPFVVGSQVDEVIPFPKNPRDLQMIQDVMVRQRDVAIACGVHPVLVGLEARGQTWGGTVRALLHGFKVFTLNSHAERFNSEITYKVYPELPDARAGFNINEMDRGDASERAARYKLALAGSPWKLPSRVVREEAAGNPDPEELAEAQKLDEALLAGMARGGNVARQGEPEGDQ